MKKQKRKSKVYRKPRVGHFYKGFKYDFSTFVFKVLSIDEVCDVYHISVKSYGDMTKYIQDSKKGWSVRYTEIDEREALIYAL